MTLNSKSNCNTKNRETWIIYIIQGIFLNFSKTGNIYILPVFLRTSEIEKKYL